jgi:ribosomal protein L11 methyltransferase
MNENENKKSWLQIVIEVEPKHEDMASWLMMQLGANGCQVFVNGAKDKISLEASFAQADINESVPDKLKKINASLDEYGLAYSLNSMQVKTIEEQDWLLEWKKGYVPFTVGEVFLICPIWLKDNLTEAELNKYQIILIDPGMAFGTGYHATTQFCLQALIQYREKINVLDVGAGSGILSIAFAKLNEKAKIIALEIEPDAVKSAKENIVLNKTDKQITLIEGSTDLLLKLRNEKQINFEFFDVILSNLTCEDIMALLPDYQELLSKNGVIICAGILKEKLPLLEKALLPYNMGIKEREINGMWAGVLVTRLS